MRDSDENNEQQQLPEGFANSCYKIVSLILVQKLINDFAVCKQFEFRGIDFEFAIHHHGLIESTFSGANESSLCNYPLPIDKTVSFHKESRKVRKLLKLIVLF